MKKEVVETLKIEYTKYLDTLGVTTSLRSLGRIVGVKNPTELKKEELIKSIIAILIGEIKGVEPSKRGAPVKNDTLNPIILKALENICLEVGGDWLLSKTETKKENVFDQYYHPEKNILGVRCSELEQTDVKNSCSSKNGFFDDNFEEWEFCLPSQKISLPSYKYVDWFLPLVKGGRMVIVSPPKAGKTFLLKEIATACLKNTQIETLGFLVEQPIETIFEFRRIFPVENLVYTTYGEEEPKAHVLAAEILLKRAKKLVESGKDVCLILEGLQALARAYDEENFEGGKILSCGLSAKTMRYIKKILSSARAFKNGGSFTIVCTTSVATGNSEDDLFFSEIASLFSTRIHLSQKLAEKRKFPAIDFEESFLANPENILDEETNKVERFFREKYLSVKGNEQFLRLIEECETVGELAERAKLQLESN